MHDATIIAQVEAPVGLAAWLACAAFIMMLANQALRLKERLLGEKRNQEIFPQPLEVRSAQDVATREYCDRNHQTNARRVEALEAALSELRDERRELATAFEAKIEILGREIPEMERRLNAANESRIEKVQDRINEVLGEVRELRGEVNHL